MRFSNRLLAVWLFMFQLLVGCSHAQAPAESRFSQAELDQMLAPVALYPDQLLAQILAASTYPYEVIQAARWSRANPDLRGQDAVRAVEDRDWDPSVQSLVAFPEVLAKMDEELEWTERLGDAFLGQREDVMDTVQSLRERAYESGNLSSNRHVEVVRQPSTIVIRSMYPDVMYVPYYDPLVVYGAWGWPGYAPMRWSPWPGYASYGPSYGVGFHWGVGISLGAAFFFSDFDWHDHHVHVVERPPFYYRRPPPPRYVWVHDYHHRRGAPYRQESVRRYYVNEYRDNYRDRDDRRDDGRWRYSSERDPRERDYRSRDRDDRRYRDGDGRDNTSTRIRTRDRTDARTPSGDERRERGVAPAVDRERNRERDPGAGATSPRERSNGSSGRDERSDRRTRDRDGAATGTAAPASSDIGRRTRSDGREPSGAASVEETRLGLERRGNSGSAPRDGTGVQTRERSAPAASPRERPATDTRREQREPRTQRTLPQREERQAPVERAQPPREERQAPVERTQSRRQERQPQAERVQAPREERQPPAERVQAPREERQPRSERMESPREQRQPRSDYRGESRYQRS